VFLYDVACSGPHTVPIERWNLFTLSSHILGLTHCEPMIHYHFQGILLSICCMFWPRRKPYKTVKRRFRLMITF
jgi:hypothetical protein